VYVVVPSRNTQGNPWRERETASCVLSDTAEVTLYQGGQYWLYKYKRYDDIRLAFAPEAAVAAFGGDPDNFQFPRWCLDMSILRAYENGKPAATPTHLTINWAGAMAGEPVFVAGHPGTTQRLLTQSCAVGMISRQP